MIAPVSPGTVPALGTPAAGAQQGALTDAAQQFEAILLRQMLAAARSTDFGGDDLFGGEGEDTFREMRDAQFAQIASESGALGFAARIEAQLSPYLKAQG